MTGKTRKQEEEKRGQSRTNKNKQGLTRTNKDRQVQIRKGRHVENQGETKREYREDSRDRDVL